MSVKQLTLPNLQNFYLPEIKNTVALEAVLEAHCKFKSFTTLDCHTGETYLSHRHLIFSKSSFDCLLSYTNCLTLPHNKEIILVLCQVLAM